MNFIIVISTSFQPQVVHEQILLVSPRSETSPRKPALDGATGSPGHTDGQGQGHGASGGRGSALRSPRSEDAKADADRSPQSLPDVPVAMRSSFAIGVSKLCVIEKYQVNVALVGSKWIHKFI